VEDMEGTRAGMADTRGGHMEGPTMDLAALEGTGVREGQEVEVGVTMLMVVPTALGGMRGGGITGVREVHSTGVLTQVRMCTEGVLPAMGLSRGWVGTSSSRSRWVEEGVCHLFQQCLYQA
jgi:hypothetical protein